MPRMTKAKGLRVPPRGQTRISANLPDFGGGYSLTVPAALARIIGPDRLFKVELTPEGVMYRYVDGGEPVAQLPDWLTG